MEDSQGGGELSVFPEPQLQVSSGGHGGIGAGEQHCANPIPPENLGTPKLFRVIRDP